MKIPQKKAGEGDEEESEIERGEPYSESALFILDPTILHSSIMSPAAVACSPRLVQPATIYLLQILSSQIACFSVRSSLVKLSALCNQIEIFYIITLKLSHISEGNLMYYHISIIKFHNFINKSRNIYKWKKCSEGDLSECSRVCEDCEGNISLSRY